MLIRTPMSSAPDCLILFASGIALLMLGARRLRPTAARERRGAAVTATPPPVAAP
jgi:hypothetical protein